MRKPRKLEKDADYHIIARANRGEMIFDSCVIKEMFMNVVRRAKKKYRFEIKNFCIMGNHIHFILRPLKNESLSAIMKWILSVFARQFNKYFRYKGHVFYDRFKSIIIHTFQQYLLTFTYISFNPVKAGLAESPTDFKYNGISFIKKGSLDILERPPTWFLRFVWPLCR